MLLLRSDFLMRAFSIISLHEYTVEDNRGYCANTYLLLVVISICHAPLPRIAPACRHRASVFDLCASRWPSQIYTTHIEKFVFARIFSILFGCIYNGRVVTLILYTEKKNKLCKIRKSIFPPTHTKPQ